MTTATPSRMIHPHQLTARAAATSTPSRSAPAPTAAPRSPVEHRKGYERGYTRFLPHFVMARPDLTAGEKLLLVALITYAYGHREFYATDRQLCALTKMCATSLRKSHRRLVQLLHDDGRPLVEVQRGRYTGTATKYRLHAALVPTPKSREGAPRAGSALEEGAPRAGSPTPRGCATRSQGRKVPDSKEVQDEGSSVPPPREGRSPEAETEGGPLAAQAGTADCGDAQLIADVEPGAEYLSGWEGDFFTKVKHRRQEGKPLTRGQRAKLAEIRDERIVRRHRDRRGGRAPVHRTGEDLEAWARAAAETPAMPDPVMLLGPEATSRCLEEESSGAAG